MRVACVGPIVTNWYGNPPVFPSEIRGSGYHLDDIGPVQGPRTWPDTVRAMTSVDDFVTAVIARVRAEAALPQADGHP